MVRGHPRCPRFCNTCSADCKCEAPACGKCHTCSYQTFRNSNTQTTTCESYMHDCHRNKMKIDDESLLARLFQFPTYEDQRLFSTNTVDISIGIGKDKVSRRVPKEALVAHSQYFSSYFRFEERRLSNAQTGSKEDTVVIEPSEAEIVLNSDVDLPDAFDMFIQYIYWQDYRPSESAGLGVDWDIRPHARVYALAERLRALGLKDLSLRKATEICHNLCTGLWNASDPDSSDAPNANISRGISLIPDIIDFVYDNTSATCKMSSAEEKDTVAQIVLKSSKDPFRELLAATSVCCLGRLKLIPKFGDCLRFSPDFAVDLVARLYEVEPFSINEQGYLTAAKSDKK